MDYETAKKILNVECNDYKEIRKKYHKQVLLHHPDKNGNKEDLSGGFQKGKSGGPKSNPYEMEINGDREDLTWLIK